jgi:cell division protein ZapA
MAELTVTVAGRAYRLACRDGEEAALRAAAAEVDGIATGLIGTLGAVGEGRLLLMTALSLAGGAGAAAPDSEPLAALADRVERLAERLEAAAASA